MCFQLCNYMPLTMVIHMVAGINFPFVLFVFEKFSILGSWCLRKLGIIVICSCHISME